MFVDKATVTLQAGKGGDGLASFRRERYISRGGPDGGDGGDGGDIVFIASSNENTLANFRHSKLLKAENGGNGGRRKRHGKRGADLEIKLPVGTVVANVSGEILADLAKDNLRVVIASGGKGGFGNSHFTSSIRQAPTFSEKGEPGQQLEAILELKLIADVGLVGLPNAGKSTLLSVISNAQPEIADYPFTTLRPNLGVADIDGQDSLLFADIPGLIEGAHQGKGLGDDFLRHIERTSVVVHLIDIYNQELSAAYKTVIGELKAYRTDLSKRPQIVVLTKTEGFDQKQLQAKINELKKLTPRGTLVLAISAQSHEGLKELLRATLKKVEQYRQKAAAAPPKLPVIGVVEDESSWKAVKAGDKFVVTGAKIERFATRTRFDQPEAVDRLRDIMRKTGIVKQLERLGIESGQTIIIGQPEIGRLEY